MTIDVAKNQPSLREAFGLALVELAPDYEFTVVDSDVAGGTGTYRFRDAYPDRFIQTGISEQAACGISAGIALADGRPVFWTTFAAFGLRAFEIFRLSVAYNQAPVIAVFSHLGVGVGPDGASAQSLEHYAVWRTLPGVVVLHPASQAEMTGAVKFLLERRGAAVLFTGRSPVAEVPTEFNDCKAQLVRDGDAITLVACGDMTSQAFIAGQRLAVAGIEAQVLNLSAIKPLDVAAILRCARQTGRLLVIEDHGLNGGLLEQVALATHSVNCQLYGLNTDDRWGQSGENLFQHYGLDAAFIVKIARSIVNGR